jgi:hypothetical protein
MPMKLVHAILRRSVDAIDLIFDAGGSILRVLFRGAFAPDIKSYRGSRFATLGATDVLVQEIALNATDAQQARKAIGLDPDRHLPLSLDAALFDVVGPIDDAASVRVRPERRYLVGLARTDVLQRLRTAMPARKRTVVEAFVHAPTAHPAQALVFREAVGVQRRRMRRTLLFVALLAFAATSAEALNAGRIRLDRVIAAADAERVAAERRVRLAERRLEAAQHSLNAVQAEDSPSLALVSARLGRLSAHQPLDTETLSVEARGAHMRLAGRTYDSLKAELALRRAFEGETLAFTADTETPASFIVELGAPAPSREAQR